MKGALLLAGFIVFTLLGNLCFKRGSAEIASMPMGFEMALTVLRSTDAWLGGSFYAIAAACWFLALSMVPLNIAITVSACVYILVVLLAFLFFKEPIPPMRWVGIGLVFTGLVFVGRTL